MTQNQLSKTIRLITVDDHQILRGGIRMFLLAFDDIELVGEASNGKEAIALCEKLQPDVVLMDLMMTGMNGVQTTKIIKEKYPQIQVLIFTSFLETELLKQAFQAGAIGYLLKDVLIDELENNIRAAAFGRSLLSQDVIQELLKESPPSANPLNQLSNRQKEILMLIAKGMTNDAIAKHLHLSASTVRNHITQIFNKLGVKNRVEAVKMTINYQ